MDRAAAWEVTEPGGNRALFKDQASADNYAMRTHGTLRALFYGRRRSDRGMKEREAGAQRLPANT